MKLDYGTQLSRRPIKLSFGTLRKPILDDIADITFDKYYYYQALIKMTPKIYYTKVADDTQKDFWYSLLEEEKEQISLYHIILEDESLRNSYVELLGFFFIEPVIFAEGYFVLLKMDADQNSGLTVESINGVLSEDAFLKVIDLLQQICCIDDKKEDEDEEILFKNDIAEAMYAKMHKSDEEKIEKKNINLSLPNIISSVSNIHPTINPINVWDLTVFQLMDAFNRVQSNLMYDIESTRVSVWGDEKNQFDYELWRKNKYETSN